MRQATARQSAVRDIGQHRLRIGKVSGKDVKTVTAQLSISSASLARLLSISGSQTDFTLASTDGRTTVRVGLAVSSVPGAKLVIGSRGRRVVLDWARSTIALGQNKISLSRMELRLLAALMETGAAAVSREQLIARLWPSDSARADERSRALYVWIFALRRRFASIGVPSAIRTVRKTGYALNV